MCGRFTQRYTWEELHRLYRLTQPARNIRPQYNICPTDPIDVIIPGDSGLPNLGHWSVGCSQANPLSTSVLLNEFNAGEFNHPPQFTHYLRMNGIVDGTPAAVDPSTALPITRLMLWASPLWRRRRQWRRLVAYRGRGRHPHLAVDNAYGAERHVVRPQVEGRTAAQVETSMVPVAGENDRSRLYPFVREPRCNHPSRAAFSGCDQSLKGAAADGGSPWKRGPGRGPQGTRGAPAGRWCKQPGLPFQL